MTKLSVNLNKIALIRNSRGRNFPSVESFAHLALESGAAGVTIHPRPDERHARYSDAVLLKNIVSEYPGTELNIEGYPCERFIKTILDVEPHQCTLVPDSPDQVTSDHGWDLSSENPDLMRAIDAFKATNIRVSLFMDPVIDKIKLVKDCDVDRIELYTESWAQAFETPKQTAILKQYEAAALAAQEIGLEVNAGHDLNLKNLAAFLTIPNIAEVSIGHALIVESLKYGFANTVKRYVKLCPNEQISHEIAGKHVVE